MINKIRNRLTEYLGFNSDELFKCGTLVRVFGGAVRDSICGDKIHDIDILCGSKSIYELNQLLKSQGYIYMESLTPKDLSNIYKDIKTINEPHSWVKRDKIVQVIRPTTGHNFSQKDYTQTYKELISNVDISCCAVSIDGINLYESYENAITHCINKVYIINHQARMYNRSRITHRIAKFSDRGWREIEENDKSVIRDIKIDSVLSNTGEYICEWLAQEKVNSEPIWK